MNNTKTPKRHKKLIVTLSVIATVIAAIAILAVIYVNDYYRAQDYNVSDYISNTKYEVKKFEDNAISFLPDGYKEGDEQAGIIFYPGGKVEYTAYKALMEALASRGVVCVLVKMPFNLAIFDIDAADGIAKEYPEVDKWYMAGHSLGGSAAAMYAEDNSEDFAGLILLASYSMDDISDEGLRVLSIYGSEDKVLNMENYKEYESNLPKDYVEVVIQGGCHAYFGIYGAQEGDGTPSISNVEQIKVTVEKIVEFVK